MYNIFYKYLLLNQKAAVPGIGYFTVEETPAKMDFITQTISAPNQEFRFTNETNCTIEKTFLFYLSKELKVNEVEAINRVNQFAQTVKEGALNGGVNLPGLGILKRSYEDVIYFVPEYNYAKQPLLTNIHLEHTVAANANLVDLYDAGDTRILKRENAAPEEEKIVLKEKEDYWWVYAIVLAILGLGALLYYYI
ncbi:MAG: hypothetical protein JSR09_11710 [Bacteroidetes bacterium]|nr:hypothetical protein [Bacteroidota bacterium]MBS1650359.1 hypothetical protein [Bacteroidota bacterium]